jgi:mRNA-degrading endonuclease RelE of RelBE toxin-antitoxin system
LKKIEKKDKRLYEATMKRIEDIVENPSRYKPLRYDLKGRRRVHLENCSVLTFRIDETDKKVTFLDLAHHDQVYKKR